MGCPGVYRHGTACKVAALVFARCSRNELIRHIEFLKAENEILRKRVPQKKITLNHEERARLLKLGKAFGPRVNQLITIVHPHTYRRWLWREQNHVSKKRMGRPRMPSAIEELVLKQAKETGWGHAHSVRTIVSDLWESALRLPADGSHVQFVHSFLSRTAILCRSVPSPREICKPYPKNIPRSA